MCLGNSRAAKLKRLSTFFRQHMVLTYVSFWWLLDQNVVPAASSKLVGYMHRSHSRIHWHASGVGLSDPEKTFSFVAYPIETA